MVSASRGGAATPRAAKRSTPRPTASAVRWRTFGSASSRAFEGLLRNAPSTSTAGIDGVAQDVEARALDAAVRQAQRGDQLGLHVLREQPRRRAGVVEVGEFSLPLAVRLRALWIDTNSSAPASLRDVHPCAQVGGLGGVGAVAAGEVGRPGEDRARAATPQVALEPQPDVQVDVLLRRPRPALGISAPAAAVTAPGGSSPTAPVSPPP